MNPFKIVIGVLVVAGILIYVSDAVFVLRSRRHAAERAAAAQTAPRRLTVAFMGEDEGRLEPCGCTPAMLGGLARRRARIDASRDPAVPMFVVSGGGVVAGSEDYDRLKFAAFAHGFFAIGCGAFAPSQRELAFPPAAFTPFGWRGPFATLANLASRPDELSRVVSFKQGRMELTVAGLVARPVENEQTLDPFRVAREVRDELPRGAPLVLLTDLRATAAKSLADSLRGPTLVLFQAGDTDPRDADATPGSVAIAPYPAHGKYVGLAHLAGEGGDAVWTIEYRPVVAELPKSPEVEAARRELLASLRKGDLVRRHAGNARFAVGAAPPEGERFAGSDTCTPCHAAEAEIASKTKHAHAFATLGATGDDADPDCVRCHVVGYGTGRGFVSTATTPALSNVGCEACHGPRARHVEARRAGKADPRAPAAGMNSCVGCHDGEHSPNFVFATAWPLIAHGPK